MNIFARDDDDFGVDGSRSLCWVQVYNNIVFMKWTVSFFLDRCSILARKYYARKMKIEFKSYYCLLDRVMNADFPLSLSLSLSLSLPLSLATDLFAFVHWTNWAELNENDWETRRKEREKKKSKKKKKKIRRN